MVRGWLAAGWLADPTPRPCWPWYTYRWYLHPRQHATEMLLALVIFVPLLVVTYARMVQQMRALRWVLLLTYLLTCVRAPLPRL